MTDQFEIAAMDGMTPDQQMLFALQYPQVKKQYMTALLLTFFLGGLGVHHFYFRKVGLGILYAVFSLTLVPACIAFIEVFFVSGRVDTYNKRQAKQLATRIRAIRPAA